MTDVWTWKTAGKTAVLAAALGVLAGFQQCEPPPRPGSVYWLPAEDPAPRGLAIRVNKKVTRALSFALEQTGVLDIENLIPEDLEVETPFGEYRVKNFHDDDKKAVRSDGSRIDIRPTETGLGIQYVVFNLDVRGRFDPDPAPDKCDVDIYVPRTELNVDVLLSHNIDGTLNIEIDDVDVDFEQFDVNIDECIWDSLAELGGLDLKKMVKDEVADAIEDMADNDAIGEILRDLGEYDVGGALSQAVGFDVQTAFRGVPDKSSVGFSMKIDLGVAAPNPLLNILSSFAVRETFPTYSKNTPVGNEPYGLGAGLSTAAINQAIMAATDEGLLYQTVVLRDQNGEALDPFVDLILMQLGVAPEDGEATLVFSPQIVPFVSGDLGPGNAMVDLHVDSALLDLRTANGGLVFRTVVVAEVGLDASFDEEAGGLALEVTPGPIEARMVNNLSTAPDHQVESVVEAFAITALPDLAMAIDPLALPDISLEIENGTFIGIGIDGLEISKEGDYLSAFADPVVHLCLDDNGEIDESQDPNEITCYRDKDDDGWPGSAGPVRVIRCGEASEPRETCPHGWIHVPPSHRPLDCNDMDNRVHPDMEVYFQWETLDGGFDFNCDGVETKKYDQSPLDEIECGESGFLFIQECR